MTASLIKQDHTKVVISVGVVTPTNLTIGTSVFAFESAKPYLSHKQLRRPHVDEDFGDLAAIEDAKRENVFFSFEEVCHELGVAR